MNFSRSLVTSRGAMPIAALLACSITVIMIGCSHDSVSPVGTSAEPLARVTSSPHPAFVFKSTNITKGRGYYALAVSDSDGTNHFVVYTCPTTTVESRFPTWSPDGASVSFVEGPYPTNNWYNSSKWGDCSIKAIDLSVTRGTVSGGNTRTICSYALADSVKIIVQAWCPAAGVNKIAFLAIEPHSYSIYTVASNGGTPTKIYSVDTTSRILSPGPYTCPDLTWSNDGTKLAFVERSPESTPAADRIAMIRVIDLSGNIVATLDSGAHILGGAQWSHAGEDVISYHGTTQLLSTTNTDYNVYTIGTTSGATPTLVKSAAGAARWSPDNSELIYTDYATSTGAVAKIDLATGATTSLSQVTVADYGDWKKP